jgi:hypothetical protein
MDFRFIILTANYTLRWVNTMNFARRFLSTESVSPLVGQQTSEKYIIYDDESPIIKVFLRQFRCFVNGIQHLYHIKNFMLQDAED